MQCSSSKNLNLLAFGRIASAKHTAPTHMCFYFANPIFATSCLHGSAKFTLSSHPQPRPAPSHFGHRRTTTIVGTYIYIYTYLSCKNQCEMCIWDAAVLSFSWAIVSLCSRALRRARLLCTSTQLCCACHQ